MWLPLLVACAPVPDPPVILGVSPGFGYNGESTPIQIAGDNFFPKVTLQQNGGQVEDGVQVWLEGPEKLRVVSRLVDVHAIEAEVPENLPTGYYDLRVVTPFGDEVRSAKAFEVTDNQADHLHLSADAVAWSVGETAVMDLSVQGPENQAVNQRLQVQITATNADGLASVDFGDGLIDQTEQTGGVVGWLGEDGTGKIRVTSTVPDNVTFTATPVEAPLKSDSLLMNWSPGGVANAVLTFEDPEFSSVVVGSPFKLRVTLVDALGNPVPDDTASVILFENSDCGGWSSSDAVKGEQLFSISLTRPCTDNFISAYVANTVVNSEHFKVLPGPLADFRVTVLTASVEAGTGRLPMLVEAVDRFGNRVPDYQGTLSLTDTAGGLNTDLGVGAAACSIFVEGQQICSVTLLTAASTNAITVRDADITGSSNSFSVTPGLGAQLALIPSTSSLTAGQTFDLRLLMQDAWNNTVNFDPAIETVTLTDEAGPVDCTWVGPNPGGGEDYSCILTRADPSDYLYVSVRGLEGATHDPLSIENGALSRVTLGLPSTAKAGVAVAVPFEGTDAWDNPFVTQKIAPVLDLSDSSGTLTPSTVTLGPAGTVTENLSFTRSGPSVVTAAQAGTSLGSSSLVVGPGDMASLLLETPTWIERGKDLPVRIRAVDAWSNTVPTFATAGTVGGLSGLCDSVAVTGFVDGESEVSVSCAVAGLAERLSAEAGGYSGTSDPVDVVDFGCTDGPTASLLLNSSRELVTCLSGGTVAVQADAAGSLGGSRNIVVYHYDDGAGEGVRSTLTLQDYTWSGAGYRSVELVVVDSEACGDLDTVSAWLGENDGSPTGPIDVSVASSSVSNNASTTVQVTATDCAGDPAVGSVYARADLGTLALTASGAGLQAALDVYGSASFDWNFSSGYAADATLYVGTDASYGEGSVTVTGDAVRPTVVEVQPSGLSSDLSTITVQFSEAIRANSISSSTISLTGPMGAVPFTSSLSTDGMTLVLSTAADASAGAYTLTLNSSVRDDAQGNRLDGSWSGSASDFQVSLGTVSVNLPTVNGCVVDVDPFYPDGDDGAGNEADQVNLSSFATTAPRWWWLEVEDATGTRIWSTRTIGTDYGASWNGRDFGGSIVEEGSYTLRITPVDDNGNLGTSCETPVEVRQHVSAL